MYKSITAFAAFALAGCLPLFAGCGGDTQVVPFDAASATAEQQIIHAARTGDIATLRQFMAQEPTLANQYDSAGKTLLHYAAMNSQMEVARYLLENGADINAPGYRTETPLDDALGAEASPEMIRFLEEQGAHD